MKQRLFALGIIAGVAAIALVVGFVFFFGRLDPSPPSLRDNPQPAIAGEILYVTEKGCIRIARASGEGEHREVICRSDIQGATWLSDGRVLYSGYPKGPSSTWWVIDPATGQQTQVPSTTDWWTSFGEATYQSPDGQLTAVAYGTGGGVAVIGPDGRERVIYEYDGRDDIYPEFRTWSPDGKYLAVFYGRRGEIWLIAADGSLAGTLTGDARWGSISWRIDGIGYLPKMRQTVGGLE